MREGTRDRVNKKVVSYTLPVDLIEIIKKLAGKEKKIRKQSCRGINKEEFKEQEKE